MVLDASALSWLAETLENRPEEVEERPEEISAPVGLPDRLLGALDARLAAAEGMARMAYLVAVRYGDGRRSHLLAFVEPLPGAEPSLARAVGEALTFSGLEAGVLDVGFFRPSDPVCARLARVGLQFDLPQPPKPQVNAGANPGMDPDRPPKLR
jgi:hypothetical protein